VRLPGRHKRVTRLVRAYQLLALTGLVDPELVRDILVTMECEDDPARFLARDGRVGEKGLPNLLGIALFGDHPDEARDTR
jgi:hypothetical protein